MTFEDRLKIAQGAAQGLLYLHTFVVPPIVHRDIKPDNILLGEDYNVRLFNKCIVSDWRVPPLSNLTLEYIFHA